MFETPVLFLVFNRPDTTRQVFERIRQIRPRQLFVAADGPRHSKEGEQKKTDEVRQLILDGIDWDCEIKTLFREQNLGCGKAVSEGITWFFENVEQGIILEDDTLPALEFFSFCEELLHHYGDDQRVMHISGSNYHQVSDNLQSSYFFSKYGLIWGWATWRRAWQYYELNISMLPDVLEHDQLTSYYAHEYEVQVRQQQYEAVYNKTLDTWDYQWALIRLIQNGLSIIPKYNFISNIGFNNDATHTIDTNSVFANLPTNGDKLEKIVHPDFLVRDIKFDIFINSQTKPSKIKQSFFSKLLRKIKSLKS